MVKGTDIVADFKAKARELESQMRDLEADMLEPNRQWHARGCQIYKLQKRLLSKERAYKVG